MSILFVFRHNLYPEINDSNLGFPFMSFPAIIWLNSAWVSFPTDALFCSSTHRSINASTLLWGWFCDSLQEIQVILCKKAMWLVIITLIQIKTCFFWSSNTWFLKLSSATVCFQAPNSIQSNSLIYQYFLQSVQIESLSQKDTAYSPKVFLFVMIAKWILVDGWRLFCENLWKIDLWR